MFIVGILFGITIGVPLGMKFVRLLDDRAKSKQSKDSEKIFVEISKKDITFRQRIGNYLYLTTEENLLLYAVKEREVVIFKPDNTILTASSLCKEKTSELFINMIETKFKKEINEKLVDFNGIKIQESVFKKILPDYIETEMETDDLNMDNILDKIHEKGLKSLTDKELEFLKNNSK